MLLLPAFRFALASKRREIAARIPPEFSAIGFAFKFFEVAISRLAEKPGERADAAVTAILLPHIRAERFSI